MKIVILTSNSKTFSQGILSGGKLQVSSFAILYASYLLSILGVYCHFMVCKMTVSFVVVLVLLLGFCAAKLCIFCSV